MAKKSSGGSRSNFTGVVRVAAFIALAIAALFMVLDFIFTLVGGNLGSIASFMRLIRDIGVGIAIGLAAYDFVKNKKQIWRIIYWICIVVYVVFLVLIPCIPYMG